MNKITVKQALERGILRRHTDYLGRFFSADLCGSVRRGSSCRVPAAE